MDNTAKLMVSLGQTALVILDTTAQGNQIPAGQMSQKLEVLAHLVTSVQLDPHIQFPAEVASTTHVGPKVSALFVLQVTSVQMLQLMLLTVPKDITAPMAQHQPFHVQKDLSKTSPWGIKRATAQSALLESTASSVACLSHQDCVQVAGTALVGHGRGCHSTQVT